MQQCKISQGDVVRSVVSPAWGCGFVVEVLPGKVHVFFLQVGDKKLCPNIARIEQVVATPAETEVFDILRSIEPWEHKYAHHRVYAIELDAAVLEETQFRDRNPRMRAGHSCLYVGATGLTPEQRFENHRSGYKSSRFVSRYGMRLRPELYAHWWPVLWSRMTKLEPAFADLLREWGYGVWQN